MGLCVLPFAVLCPAGLDKVPYLLSIMTHASYFYLGYLMSIYSWDKVSVYHRLFLVMSGVVVYFVLNVCGMSPRVLLSLVATVAVFAITSNLAHPLIRHISINSFGL